MAASRTKPLYQSEQTATRSSSVVASCMPFSTAPAAVQALFTAPQTSGSSTEYFLLTTGSTIFHPQGGGQPSDTGLMSDPTRSFRVVRVRHDPEPGHAGSILHCGHFEPHANGALWAAGAPVSQRIAARRRALHSRLHTAGHIVGLAVRGLGAAGALPTVAELKASHFPDAASVEFRGRIESSARVAVQAEVDRLVERDLAVVVHQWTPAEANERCTGVPEGGLKAAPGDASEASVRVVEVKGAGGYPCGGTHLPRTADVGKVILKSVKRSKDVTRISYRVGNSARTEARDAEATREDSEWMTEDEMLETEEFFKAYFRTDAV